MPLEDFIITVFCWVEEHLNALLGDHRLRQRGFAPKLSDGEVITMEAVSYTHLDVYKRQDMVFVP